MHCERSIDYCDTFHLCVAHRNSWMWQLVEIYDSNRHDMIWSGTIAAEDVSSHESDSNMMCL